MKRKQLQALKLEPEEWERLERFLNLLSVRFYHSLKGVSRVLYSQAR